MDHREKRKGKMVAGLTADRVATLFKECWVEVPYDASDEDVVSVESITSAAFSADKLKEHEDEIWELLAELPDEFKQSSGGGMSFLNACNDRHGEQWTGFHATMESLFLLGIAIDAVKPLFPREFWSALPGGVPYYVILDVNSGRAEANAAI